MTVCVIAGLVACSKPAVDQGLDYPKTRVSEHTDLYHGEAVSDPYRWLEDDLSTETKDWIERQNDTTFGYLANIPYRDELKDRYAALIDYPTESAPFTEGDWQYFY
ncbi:MAG: S9 family peptidase, partial [Gammaproteobacteria bacterium]